MSDIYNDPRWAGMVGGQTIPLERIGDTAVGQVVSLRIDEPQPQQYRLNVELRQQDGQVRLFRSTAQQVLTKWDQLRPQVGDFVALRLTNLKSVGQGRTMKEIDVQVQRAVDHAPNTMTGQPAPQPTYQPSAPDPFAAGGFQPFGEQ
jgi:hypothetical protein